MVLSVEQLLNLNVVDSDIQDIKSYTVLTTRPDLRSKNNNITKKINVWSLQEETNKHTWKFDDFDYNISSLGFRDRELSSHITLAAFGCSYTFGQGLPENKIWHRLLDEESYNFGQPGASIKSITDIFAIISKHIKIKNAVFLLPSYLRQLVAAEKLYDSNVNLIPVLPNYNGMFQQDYNIQTDSYYKYMPDIELLRRMKDDLYMLDFLSKIHDIKTYVSSWDRPTYNHINSMSFNNLKVLPEWTSPNIEKDKQDLARDRFHPGMSHHKYWAEQIQDIVCK